MKYCPNTQLRAGITAQNQTGRQEPSAHLSPSPGPLLGHRQGQAAQSQQHLPAGQGEGSEPDLRDQGLILQKMMDAGAARLSGKR